MAVIGVQHAIASPISAYGTNSAPTYGTGFIVSRLTKVDSNLEYNDNSARSDNSIEETDKSFSKGTITFGTYGLGKTLSERYNVMNKLFGSTVSTVGSGETASTELVVGANDISQHVGFGYVKTERSNNVDSYIARWYFDVQFAPPAESVEAQGESINFQTQDINGTVFKIDGFGKDNIYKEKICNTLTAALEYVDTLANLPSATQQKT